MSFIFSDTSSTETEQTDINLVKDILKKPYQYWQEGTGDSSVHIDGKERLVFFKLEQGVFIMQHPDYLSPVIDLKRKAKPLTHYVGGEPMQLPDVCLCDEEKAFEIIEGFIQSNGKLSMQYKWVDIYELLDYKE